MEDYGITLKQAKKSSSYSFYHYMTVEELKQRLKAKRFNSLNLAPMVLELGYLSIELHVYTKSTTYELSYHIYGHDYEGWDVMQIIDKQVDLEVIDIEKFMFEMMLKYGNENGLTWSEPNEEMEENV